MLATMELAELKDEKTVDRHALAQFASEASSSSASEVEFEGERAGLLNDSEGSKEVGTSSSATGVHGVLEEMKVQGFLAGPLATNLLLISIRNIITLSFVGRFGTEDLAGSALAQSVTFMFGSLPLIGMSCALDTLASQAFGAGQIDSLSLIYQRTVAFLAVHCCGLTLLVLSLPTILQAVGEDTGICHKVAIFSRALLPGVWFDILNRPLNRILVAQKVTKPQAVVSFACTLLHLLINWLFVERFGWGPVAVAWANSLANLNMLLGMVVYVLLYGQGYCCWGKGLTLQALKDWRPYAKIAYPACFMECAESWCWGSMSILAGLLPNPALTVSSLTIAFSLFTAMFFVYLSQGLACSTRVGNCLGAGDAKQAQVAMLAARNWVPITWMFSAFLFTEPHIRAALVWLYTDGTDQDLVKHIHNLLWMMVILNASDGLQCVLTGVIQGLGRQAVGFKINVVSFYVVAIPSACLFAFVLGWSVEGLYCGLIMGATCQAASYLYYTSSVDWEEEAKNAVCRVEAVAASAPPTEP